MKSYDQLFGEVAIQLKLLTREQLARCLNLQRAKPGKRLGEICVALGYLEPGQAQFILEQQAGVKRRASQMGLPPVAPRTAGGQGKASRVRRKKRPTLDDLLAGYLDKVTGDQRALSGRAAAADLEDERVNPARKERINKLSQMLARIIVENDDRQEEDEAPPPRKPRGGARREPIPKRRVKPEASPAPVASEPAAATEPVLPPPEPAPPPPEPVPPPPEADSEAPEWLEATSHEPLEPAAAAPATVPPVTASTPAPDAAPAPASAFPAQRAQGPLTIAPGSLLHRALKAAAEHQASDLHLHSGSPLLLRRDGRLRPLPAESETLDPESAARIIGEFMGEERWQEFLATREMDLACALPGVGRFRVNAYMQQRGPDVVFRLLPIEPPTLEALGLPARLGSLTQFRTGVVLCTGPTGCGKSSTLAALLDMVVQSRQEHIITIEDPIEFIYRGGKGLVNQRQIGAHTESFARALRAALREDPDVIGITELRDPETIALALSAAETGHLVLGSLHTGSAMQTITRIVNAFSADQQAQVRVMLSESLRAVISQRLVARADGQGRAVALEVLVITPAVSNLIREDKAFQLPSAMQVGRAHGMQLLDDSLEQLVSDGTVTREEACKHATNPQRFGAAGGAR